ncbi:MAG: DNA topoisomerase IV subunit A, partial [Burkholderiales bacterium]|nr:DNA topoisomerase IV subunit A [Burkholderiales bacterium]
QRGGKSFLTLDEGARLLPPVALRAEHSRVAALAGDGRLLVFGLDELKLQPGGGKGLTLMDVDAQAPLIAVAALADEVTVRGTGRGGKPREERLKGAALAAHEGRRARKGRKVEGVLKPLGLG